MQLFNLLWGRVWILKNRDWSANDSVDGFPIGHQAKAVLKDPSGMEQGKGEPHHLLQSLLHRSKPRAFRVADLFKQFVFTKGKNWNQVSTMHQCSLYKSFALADEQGELPRVGIQGLLGAPEDNDRDVTPALLAQHVGHALLGNRDGPTTHQILSEERTPEPERQHVQIGSEARKELLEGRVVGTKIPKGSSHENSMGVEAKYVIATQIQVLGLDEMDWKIVVKMPPNGPASDPIGSPAPLLWGSPVKEEPGQIRDVEVPVVA